MTEVNKIAVRCTNVQTKKSAHKNRSHIIEKSADCWPSVSLSQQYLPFLLITWCMNIKNKDQFHERHWETCNAEWRWVVCSQLTADGVTGDRQRPTHRHAGTIALHWTAMLRHCHTDFTRRQTQIRRRHSMSTDPLGYQLRNCTWHGTTYTFTKKLTNANSYKLCIYKYITEKQHNYGRIRGLTVYDEWKIYNIA